MLRMDTDRLRGKMAEKHVTQENLAKRIGIDVSTFYRKMQSNGLAFTVGQMHSIANALELTAEEATNIFLLNNSQ